MYEGRAQNPTHLEEIRLGDGRILKHLGYNDMEYKEGSTDTLELHAWQTKNGLHVLSSMDPTPNWGLLLHVSVSYEKTDPSWKDLLMIREVFFDDTIDCMMVMPKSKDYVNYHPHTFHIWQTPTECGLM